MVNNVKPITVSQLNDYVAGIFSRDPMLRSVCIKGEISNIKRTAAKHVYFSLKDNNAQVSCVMFKDAAEKMPILPTNGEMAIVCGYVALYTRDGQYQVYVDTLEVSGFGGLYVQFEQLKEKLLQEGYFNPSRKKILPYIPRKVGVVTSATGAVIHDICNVLRRRFAAMPIMLCPTKVQGEGAALQIASAIGLLDAIFDVEVIIIARGGGTIEDLWAFNELAVVQAIYNCKTPIVCAVGHETDYTLADFAADCRAPTPSAAAELVVPSSSELIITIDRAVYRANMAMYNKIRINYAKVEILAQRLKASHPKHELTQDSTKLVHLNTMLKNSINRYIENKQNSFDASVDHLKRAAIGYVKMQNQHLEMLLRRLKSASPKGILAKGYAMVYKEEGLMQGVGGLKSGDDITIVMGDGKLGATVTTVFAEE